MLNYIWFGMLVMSVLCSLFTGRTAELSRAVTDGADKAVRLVISMAGVMCLWTGILKIAEKSGVTGKISALLAPVIKLVMPECRNNKKAMEAVSANITANIFGLGNAATPLGLKAMKELQKTNRLINSPDNSMVMFVVINTASLQLIPSTIAAMRQAAGSEQPFAILPYIWITSILTLITGIMLAKIFSLRR
ncbi:MAG: spore maturation protein A [Clostridia bacterium]|nr:spore maturation protein A [Clostridia bacterium]